MLLFWKAGLVLLAVPKTGTQAYEAALRGTADVVISHPTHLKHMNAKGFRNNFRKLVDPNQEKAFTTVAVIREPLDWLGSWYRYRQRPWLEGDEKSTAGISFDSFVRAHLKERPPAFADVGRQSRFVSNNRGKVIVDHLFAYDQLDELRRFLEAKLGHPIEPEARNTSPTARLTLSDPVRAQLAQDYAAEYELYQAVSLGAFLPLFNL